MLGVDPGSLRTGYGVIQRTGNTVRLLASGVIRNSGDRSMPDRLLAIHDGLAAVIERWRPSECAIESAFYGKNAQSAMKLGHARGVSILAAVRQGLTTAEYAPRAVKKAVTGNGTASKEQVQAMVRTLLQLGTSPMPLDASDAVAVALCHLQSITRPSRARGDWASYIAAHPERVRS